MRDLERFGSPQVVFFGGSLERTDEGPQVKFSGLLDSRFKYWI